MSLRFIESIVEEAALAWLESQGYTILHGRDIAPGEPAAERADYGQVVLEDRLRQTLHRLNPEAPMDALDEAFRRLTKADSPSLVVNNHIVHRYLVEGVPVATWQLKPFANFWKTKSRLEARRMLSKRVPFRNCWRLQSSATRTGPSRPQRSLRS